MPMWRCPHCATPQPEVARCWVCHRSSTSCSTCRHFRRSVAAQIGYCGLDRRRLPLTGDEIRACWAAVPAAPAGAAPPTPLPVVGARARTSVLATGLVAVGDVIAGVGPGGPDGRASSPHTLFGDPDEV